MSAAGGRLHNRSDAGEDFRYYHRCPEDDSCYGCAHELIPTYLKRAGESAPSENVSNLSNLSTMARRARQINHQAATIVMLVGAASYPMECHLVKLYGTMQAGPSRVTFRNIGRFTVVGRLAICGIDPFCC
jgi:hypothetical protein